MGLSSWKQLWKRNIIWRYNIIIYWNLQIQNSHWCVAVVLCPLLSSFSDMLVTELSSIHLIYCSILLSSQTLITLVKNSSFPCSNVWLFVSAIIGNIICTKANIKMQVIWGLSFFLPCSIWSILYLWYWLMIFLTLSNLQF